jgi:hypothetical protein
MGPAFNLWLDVERCAALLRVLEMVGEGIRNKVQEIDNRLALSE